MKRAISIILSIVILLSCNIGIELNAYAGDFDTAAKAKSYTLGSTAVGCFSSDNEIEFLKVNVPQSGRIEFISEGSHSYHIYLYSVNNSDNYIADIFVPYNSSLGKAYDKEYDYLVAGTYYFKIDGYANENYTVRTFLLLQMRAFPKA